MCHAELELADRAPDADHQARVGSGFARGRGGSCDQRETAEERANADPETYRILVLPGVSGRSNFRAGMTPAPAGPPPILTERLELVAMSAAFIEALLAGRRTEAAALAAIRIPDGWRTTTMPGSQWDEEDGEGVVFELETRGIAQE
jgi:hypothetical protein